MMLLKPLTLAAVLIFSSGSAWAQASNPGAPGSSSARPEKAGPSVGDEARPGDKLDNPKADGSGAGPTSKGMVDSAIGNGTGRADEDASAAAAR